MQEVTTPNPRLFQTLAVAVPVFYFQGILPEIHKIKKFDPWSDAAQHESRTFNF
jgi:hypothetical protein